MRSFSILITFFLANLSSASLGNHDYSYINLHQQGRNGALQRRSPADSPSGSPKKSSSRMSTQSDPGTTSPIRGLTAIKTSKTTNTEPSSPKEDFTFNPPIGNIANSPPRRPRAKGVLQAVYPAEGAMRSDSHGTWKTRPSLNNPSAMGKMKHDQKVCLGGSCPEPGGMLTLDALGRKVTSTIDTRAGGTAHLGELTNIANPPQWTVYGPNSQLKHTTTAQGKELVRHHVRLDGAGKIKTEGSMSIERRRILFHPWNSARDMH